MQVLNLKSSLRYIRDYHPLFFLFICFFPVLNPNCHASFIITLQQLFLPHFRLAAMTEWRVSVCRGYLLLPRPLPLPPGVAVQGLPPAAPPLSVAVQGLPPASPLPLPLYHHSLPPPSHLCSFLRRPPTSGFQWRTAKKGDGGKLHASPFQGAQTPPCLTPLPLIIITGCRLTLPCSILLSGGWGRSGLPPLPPPPPSPRWWAWWAAVPGLLSAAAAALPLFLPLGAARRRRRPTIIICCTINRGRRAAPPPCRRSIRRRRWRGRPARSSSLIRRRIRRQRWRAEPPPAALPTDRSTLRSGKLHTGEFRMYKLYRTSVKGSGSGPRC